MDSLFDSITVPTCTVSQQSKKNRLNDEGYVKEEIKEEIKEEPYDDYEDYPSSSQIYIYDPEDVKIEEEYDCYQSVEGNNDSLDTTNQHFTSSSSNYGDMKNEEPADEFDCPSSSQSAISTVVKRVVAPEIPCSICGQIFKYRLHLVKHIREEHSPQWEIGEPKKCEILVRDAKKMQSWRGHTKVDGCFYVETTTITGTTEERGTFITYLDCGVCGERFANARDHRTHAIRKHPGNKDERMCKNEYCVRMRAMHIKYPPGEVHMNGKLRARLVPMYDPVNCPICAERHPSYFELYTHFCQKHMMEYLIRFKCKSCSHTYTSPRGLMKHITKESGKFGKCCAGATIPMPSRRKQRLSEMPDNNLYMISDPNFPPE